MTDGRSRLVYSTDQVVPRKGRVPEERPDTGRPAATKKVMVRLERKGRAGKSVTVVEGLPLSRKEQGALLREMKARLGAGGTLTERSIEIQGDHRDALVAMLEGMGYRPKRSGS